MFKSRRKKERKKEKNWSRKENIAAPVIEYYEGKYGRSEKKIRKIHAKKWERK